MLSPMMPMTPRLTTIQKKYTLVPNLMVFVKKMMMGTIWLQKNAIKGNCQEATLLRTLLRLLAG